MGFFRRSRVEDLLCRVRRGKGGRAETGWNRDARGQLGTLRRTGWVSRKEFGLGEGKFEGAMKKVVKHGRRRKLERGPAERGDERWNKS